ncbi:MAG: hypothetical protein AAF311_07240 [Pseudomonadota bacterium]
MTNAIRVPAFTPLPPEDWTPERGHEDDHEVLDNQTMKPTMDMTGEELDRAVDFQRWRLAPALAAIETLAAYRETAMEHDDYEGKATLREALEALPSASEHVPADSGPRVVVDNDRPS